MKVHLFIEIVEHREPELQFFHPHVAAWDGQLEPHLIAEALAAGWYPGLVASAGTEYQWTDGEVKIEVGRYMVISKEHFEILAPYVGEIVPTTVGLDRVRQYIPEVSNSIST